MQCYKTIYKKLVFINLTVQYYSVINLNIIIQTEPTGEEIQEKI